MHAAHAPAHARALGGGSKLLVGRMGLHVNHKVGVPHAGGARWKGGGGGRDNGGCRRMVLRMWVAARITPQA